MVTFPESENSSRYRIQRIHQKIGCGYFVAISIGFAGSMVGLVVADYFQGQGVLQLVDAQVQSQLLSDFEQASSKAQLHSAQTLALLDDEARFQEEVANLRTSTTHVNGLNRAIQDYLSDRPKWVAADPNTITQLVVDYAQGVTAQANAVEAALRVEEPEEALRRVLSGNSTTVLRQYHVSLTELIQIAREQELKAADVMEEAQGFEKLIIVLSMLLACAIAGLLAWRTTRAIARPIETVTQVARQVALESDYSLRARVNTNDEVGVLAASLNHLIEQVSVHTNALAASARSAEAQAYELEQTVETLQRAQLQLVQAEKMSSLGQLAAGMLHEINNPISFIHGNLGYAHDYAQTLLEVIEKLQIYIPEPPPPLAAYLGNVELDFIREDLPKVLMSLKHGTERISSLMLSLRVFARLQESQLKRTDLREGLESVLVLLTHRTKAQPKRPEVEVIFEFGDLPWVECYGSQINQVFMNILANALDAIDDRWYQEPGGWQPEIIVQASQVGKSRVRIQICNNGLKIPDAIQTKLFDPFFTTKPVGKGVGLGLAIAYEIITEKHRGTLTYSSPLADRDVGAQFTIEIPTHQRVLQANSP